MGFRGSSASFERRVRALSGIFPAALWLVLLFPVALPGADERGRVDTACGGSIGEGTEAGLLTPEALAAFLADVGHEVRNPIAAIVLLASQLRPEEVPPSLRPILSAIQASGDHALLVLNQLVEYARIRTDGLRLESVDIDFRAFLADTMAVVRGQGTEKDELSVRFEATGALPISVRADPTRLRQVLLNLTGNAIKFTERGSVTVRIGSTPVAPSDSGALRALLSIEVIDTGPGMTGEEVSRVFRRFEQAQAGTVRLFGGAGLGLDIAKRLVERMGGSIAVRSILGEGTTFHVTIPVETGDAVAWVSEQTLARHATRSREEAPAPDALAGVRVLLADDSLVNRKLYTGILENAGAAVTQAADGAEAVNLFRSGPERFDVVILDSLMPELNGIDALERVHETSARVPVFILTADTAADRDALSRAGARGVFVKPVAPVELVRELRGAIGAE